MDSAYNCELSCRKRSLDVNKCKLGYSTSDLTSPLSHCNPAWNRVTLNVGCVRLLSRGANFFSQLCPFTCRRICVCQMCSQSVQLFGIFPIFLNLWPPNPLRMSLGARVVNLFSPFPFPDESVYMCQVWSRSVQWFGSFIRFMKWWPPNPHAPRVSRG